MPRIRMLPSVQGRGFPVVFVYTSVVAFPERRDFEDPKPPRARLDRAYPDLLHGFDEAPAGVQHVLRDAVSRLEREQIEPVPGGPSSGRIGDVRIHTQARVQYAESGEKKRIVGYAESVLDALLEKHGGVPHGPHGGGFCDPRWDDALATLEKEGERVFVAVVLAIPYDLVYWDWRFAYTVANRPLGRPLKRLRRDLRRRRVAHRDYAVQRYGAAVSLGPLEAPGAV